MTDERLKETLQRFRPGMPGVESDRELVDALAQVHNRPDLVQWFDEHCAKQEQITQSFRTIPVPPDLQFHIVSGVRASSRRYMPWLAAAAAVGLMFLFLWFNQAVPHQEAGFDAFRARMVRTVLREYRMDIHTQDLQEIRGFLAANGTPAEFELPARLESLQRLGAGKLSWQGHPVSMVCFDSGDNETLFLFVIDRFAMSKPPAAGTSIAAPVSKLETISWSEGNHVFLLAGSKL